MNQRTSCLCIQRLKPGMRLARALHRADGAVLMPENTELTDASLGQLQQRGIEYAFVSEEDTRDAAEIASDLAAAEERVNFIFRTGQASPSDDVPGMGDARNCLQAAVLAYRRAA